MASSNWICADSRDSLMFFSAGSCSANAPIVLQTFERLDSIELSASLKTSIASWQPPIILAPLASLACSLWILIHSFSLGDNSVSSSSCHSKRSRSRSMSWPAFSACSKRRRESLRALKACATSVASASNPAWRSKSSRCAPPFKSSWCACCPWMSTSRSPASRSCANVATLPLIKARLRPLVSIVLLSSKLWPLSSVGNPCSSSHWVKWFICSELIRKRAEISARWLPSRIWLLSARSPRTRLSASSRIDFPAPVSPVRTVNPAEKSSSSWSTMTKSRSEIVWSMY